MFCSDFLKKISMAVDLHVYHPLDKNKTPIKLENPEVFSQEVLFLYYLKHQMEDWLENLTEVHR